MDTFINENRFFKVVKLIERLVVGALKREKKS